MDKYFTGYNNHRIVCIRFKLKGADMFWLYFMLGVIIFELYVLCNK